MGILNIFGEGKDEQEIPENELEKCFINAGEDKKAREDFHLKLLWSNLYVITAGKDLDSRLGKESKIAIINLNNGWVPVFTSIPRMYDNNKNPKIDLSYRAIKGLDLFNILKGKTIILNPFSHYKKLFSPEEIERIMDGSINLPWKNVANEISKSSLWRPLRNPPKDVTALLVNHFKNDLTINAAYWFEISKDGDTNKIEMTVLIDTSGDFKKVLNEVSLVLNGHLSNRTILIYPARQTDMPAIVKNVEPFYKKESPIT